MVTDLLNGWSLDHGPTNVGAMVKTPFSNSKSPIGNLITNWGFPLLVLYSIFSFIHKKNYTFVR